MRGEVLLYILEIRQVVEVERVKRKWEESRPELKTDIL
jgi:hypothetical protein